MILAEIITNEKGKKVVKIDTIAFSNKRKIDWDGVEQYLKKYVGQKKRSTPHEQKAVRHKTTFLCL